MNSRPRTRILLLAKGVRSNPATRYRFLQYAPYWEAAGLKVDFKPLFTEDYYDLRNSPRNPLNYWRMAGHAVERLALRTADIESAAEADMVLLENQVFPYAQGALENRLMEINPRTVVEFDDAIHLSPFHLHKMTNLVGRAHHVIVGNRFLAEFAQRFTDRVSVVPTTVDTDRYDPTPKPPGKRIVLVWIGLPVNFTNLETLAPVLARLDREFPIELRIVSSRPLLLPGVRCSFVHWSEETETTVLADSDIGIMPLPDDEWSRGKCGLKLLQYMAAGRPCAASPVGVNADIVVNGETGFWADNSKQWYAVLRRLCAEPETRAAMGAAGRKKVERDYSLKVWGPLLMDLYRRLVADKVRGK